MQTRQTYSSTNWLYLNYNSMDVVVNTEATMAYNSSRAANNSVDVVNHSQPLCSNDYCVSDEDYLDMIRSYLFPDVFEWILIALYALLFTLGLAGNFLVCYSVWRNRSMRTVTNIFIVNLAAADFMVLDDVTETWYMGSVMCKVVKYLQGTSVSVSVLTLSCISVERWYAICHPLMFKSTPERAKAMIMLIWLVALCIPIPELIVLDTFVRFPDLTILLTSCKTTWAYQNAYQIFLIIAMYLLPLTLMFVTYFQIARCLWSTPLPSESSRDPLQPSDGSRAAMESQLKSRRKVAKMLIVVVVMFGCCYLPVHLLNILRYAGVLKHMPADAVTYFALIAHQMCYVTSAMNPVIYNVMSAKFRKEFLSACSCCVCCRRQGYTYRYTSPLTSGHLHANKPRTHCHRQQSEIHGNATTITNTAQNYHKSTL